MGDTPPLLLIGDVVRQYGVCDTLIRKLDAQLKPMRTVRGVRLYDPTVVDRVGEERQAAAEARAARRAVKQATNDSIEGTKP
jgi:hypothetical protein